MNLVSTEENNLTLKDVLERKIRDVSGKVKHTATDIKEIVDTFLMDKPVDDSVSIKYSAIVIHNTNCLELKISGIGTNEINMTDLVKMYNKESIGVEYEYLPQVGSLTLYMYPIEYRIPEWVNFGHPNNRGKQE